jgi:hypothetical protein
MARDAPADMSATLRKAANRALGGGLAVSRAGWRGAFDAGNARRGAHAAARGGPVPTRPAAAPVVALL